MHRPIATAALLAMTPFAWADRPLASETADVIDDGACQVEAWGGRTTASGTPAVRGLAGSFSCGVGSATQLAFAGSDESGGGVTVRTLVAGGKTTLVAPAVDRTGFGVAYSVDNVHVPGEGSKFDTLNVTGLVTREIVGGWLLHGNVGWSRSRIAGQNTTVWSVGIESTTNPVVAADVFGDDRGRPSFSTGLGLAFTREISVNAGFAQQFEKPAIRQWTLGAKIVF